MSLILTTTTPVTLPSGVAVDVPTHQLRFTMLKSGPTLRGIYNANPKAVVEVDGRPMFPELAVLRLIEQFGWTGVWCDTYSQGRLLQDWGDPPVPVNLPTEAEAIRARIPVTAGQWDIFAWRGDDVLFMDVKQKRKDSLTDAQRAWLESALGAGFQLSQFGIAEWTFRSANTTA